MLLFNAMSFLLKTKNKNSLRSLPLISQEVQVSRPVKVTIAREVLSPIP